MCISYITLAGVLQNNNNILRDIGHFDTCCKGIVSELYFSKLSRGLTALLKDTSLHFASFSSITRYTYCRRGEEEQKDREKEREELKDRERGATLLSAWVCLHRCPRPVAQKALRRKQTCLHGTG